MPGTLAETASLTAGYGAERRRRYAKSRGGINGGNGRRACVVASARYDSKQDHAAPMVTNGPSLSFVVQEIEVRQDARVIKRISGAQLPAQRGFAADTWTDSQGRERFGGRSTGALLG